MTPEPTVMRFREHMNAVRDHVTVMGCIMFAWPPRHERAADEMRGVADELAALAALVRETADHVEANAHDRAEAEQRVEAMIAGMRDAA